MEKVNLYKRAERLEIVEKINKHFKSQFEKKIIVVYFIFIGLYLLGVFISPSFRTSRNFYHLLSQVTPLILVGIAQSFVILTGGLDLSIGSIITLTNVAAASIPFQDSNLGIFLWILIPIAVGAGAGLVNGFFIGKFNLPPIIVTLATSSVFMGIAIFWMPIPGGSLPLSIAKFLTKNIGFISVPALLFLGITILSWYFLKYTQIGRNIYTIGGSEQVAIRVGINVCQTKLFTYTAAGIIASIAGMYLTARMYCADTSIGAPFIMDSIAIAVIGGTSLAGGQGGVFGIVAGAFIINLLNNLLNMLGISSFYQYIMKGIILIIALSISSARKNSP